MAVVTQNYYLNTYMGAAIAAEEFARYETRAEQAIKLACRGRYEALYNTLIAKGLTAAAASLKENYSNAICAQMEYYLANGILSVTVGETGEGFTVGKVSVESGSSSADARGAGMLSPAALAFLEQTGLLGRAVAVPVEPFAPFPWR